MLSYQHAYHAGNTSDIHKHGILAVLLAHLKSKKTPLTYMETHAGSGLYDLTSAESLKTGEAQHGILKYLPQGIPPAGHPYRTVLDQVRARHGQNIYPGSPVIARTLLSKDDKIHLMELHPAENKNLVRAMRGWDAHIHMRDGFEGVLGISPPKPRRGLVFIDPSYEVKTEYQTAAEFVQDLHKKWPEAVIVLWYPVLEAGLHKGMVEILLGSGLKNLTRHEINFATHKDTHRILGSGVLIVGTPFGTEQAMNEVSGWIK